MTPSSHQPIPEDQLDVIVEAHVVCSRRIRIRDVTTASKLELL